MFYSIQFFSGLFRRQQVSSGGGWTSGKQRCLDRDVLGLIPATLEEPDFSNFIKRQRTLKHLRKRYNLCYTALTTLDNYILGANSVMGLLIDKTIILYPLGS